jgi:hypothetical protein
MIRFANKFDNEQIKEFLKEFHQKHGNALSLHIDKWSGTYVDEQLAKIYAGLGFVLIANDGFLCAIKAPCFWIPKLWILQESMLFSTSKKTSVKLMKKYIEIGNVMKERDEIVEFYISNFSDADLSKFGATKVANDWVI